MTTEPELEEHLRSSLRAELEMLVPSDELLASALAAPVRHSPGPVVAAALFVPAAAVATVFVTGALGGPGAARNGPHASSPGPDSAVVLGHRVRLPKGYRLMSSSNISCQQWHVSGTPFAVSFMLPQATDVSSDLALLATQHTWSGILSSKEGLLCLDSTISTPYSLPEGTDPTSPLIGSNWVSPILTTSIDGAFAQGSTFSATTVPATVRSSSSAVSGNSGAGVSGATGTGNAGAGVSGASSSGTSSSEVQGSFLYIRIPVGGGQYELGKLVSLQLTESQLVALATQALAGAA